jgi:hypothetical protein
MDLRKIESEAVTGLVSFRFCVVWYVFANISDELAAFRALHDLTIQNATI